MQQPDVCIAGAGIMGLSLALELTRRGARVTVIDRGAALAEASTAAAGMLAANDPFNPPLLRPLAEFSLTLFAPFLDHIATLSDVRVPFQTDLTLQGTKLASVDSISPAELDIFLPAHRISDQHFRLLDEQSIDPRQLAPALIAAAENTTIRLLTGTAIVSVESAGPDLTVATADERFQPSHFVDCTGAWALTCSAAVSPRKGQMLSIALPPTSPLFLVLRTEDLYIVPRTTGPNAGRAILGATVEDAGFDKSVYPADIDRMRERVAQMLPVLADAPVLERWAGLRPATRDELPLLGPHPSNPRHLFATGHFRNGILLAPATANLIAGMIVGEPPQIDLAPFAPGRFNLEAVL